MSLQTASACFLLLLLMCCCSLMCVQEINAKVGPMEEQRLKYGPVRYCRALAFVLDWTRAQACLCLLLRAPSQR